MSAIETAIREHNAAVTLYGRTIDFDEKIGKWCCYLLGAYQMQFDTEGQAVAWMLDKKDV